MKEIRRGLSIHFNDGSSTVFEFPPQAGDISNITRRVEELLKQQYIMVEVEGALVLYPLYNVRSIQVSPAPDRLPDNCIKGAMVAMD